MFFFNYEGCQNSVFASDLYYDYMCIKDRFRISFFFLILNGVFFYWRFVIKRRKVSALILNYDEIKHEFVRYYIDQNIVVYYLILLNHFVTFLLTLVFFYFKFAFMIIIDVLQSFFSLRVMMTIKSDGPVKIWGPCFDNNLCYQLDFVFPYIICTCRDKKDYANLRNNNMVPFKK